MCLREWSFLVGASGSGKTVIGSRASSLIHWELYDTDTDTDTEILKMTGADRISDIFETQGEELFRPDWAGSARFPPATTPIYWPSPPAATGPSTSTASTT